MSKNVIKHLHKLKRHYYSNGTAVYFCTLDCDYKISPPLAIGKHTQCWRCGKEFAMNQYSITLAKPHCEECHVYKNSQLEENKRKRKRRATDPLPEISNSIAEEVTSNLKDKLAAVLHQQPSHVEYRQLPTEDDEKEML